MLSTRATTSILLVEDDRDIIVLLRAILKEAFYGAECAECASDALRLLDERPPDVVLLDCHLRGGGLGEILAKADIAGCKLVLMSGDTALLMQFAAFGYRCLQKPFRMSELMATLDQCLVPSGYDTASLS